MTAPTEVKVPDIGDFGTVPIIEVHVSAGDQVNAEDPLVTLESDKATMDIPAPVAGLVAEVLVKVGDEVSEGSPILLLIPGDGAVSTPPSLVEQQEPAPASAPAAAPAPAPPSAPAAGPAAGGVDTPAGIHAGPSVRRHGRTSNEVTSGRSPLSGSDRWNSSRTWCDASSTTSRSRTSPTLRCTHSSGRSETR